MYLEYAKNEIALSKMWNDTFEFLKETFKNTEIDTVILKPYFAPTNGKKAVGSMIISGVVALLVIIIGFCFVCCCN